MKGHVSYAKVGLGDVNKHINDSRNYNNTLYKEKEVQKKPSQNIVLNGITSWNVHL